MHTILISTGLLETHLNDSSWLIADCRYNLKDEQWGRGQYSASHIPGAVFVNVGHDLAAARTGTNGRHPLPAVDTMAATFARLGMGDATQVIAYDQDAGAFASRLWWMLRYLGQDAVAVLDGGFARWTREGRSVRGGNETRPPATFTPRVRGGRSGCSSGYCCVTLRRMRCFSVTRRPLIRPSPGGPFGCPSCVRTSRVPAAT